MYQHREGADWKRQDFSASNIEMKVLAQHKVLKLHKVQWGGTFNWKR